MSHTAGHWMASVSVESTLPQSDPDSTTKKFGVRKSYAADARGTLVHLLLA